MKDKMMMKVLLTIGTLVILGAASPAAAQGLRQTPFPDGTGSIGLAPGWRIDSAYRGTATCLGPNGEVINVGMPWTIVNPDSSVMSLPNIRQKPIATPGDIVGGLREVLLKVYRARLLSVRGNRTVGISRNTPAYILLYEIEQNGRRYTSMGYFTAFTYGPREAAWQLYGSAVGAPSESFQETVQTMVLMWRTWRPNGEEPHEGSTSAMWDKILNERRLNYEFWQREFREQL